jgi:hypothetical protein
MVPAGVNAIAVAACAALVSAMWLSAVACAADAAELAAATVAGMPDTSTPSTVPVVAMFPESSIVTALFWITPPEARWNRAIALSVDEPGPVTPAASPCVIEMAAPISRTVPPSSISRTTVDSSTSRTLMSASTR